MKITGNDLDSFFRAKGGPLVCSHCNSDDWSVPSDNAIQSPDGDLDPHILFPTIYKRDGSRTDDGIQLLAFTCVNCGNVRLQHMAPLISWLEERDKE